MIRSLILVFGILFSFTVSGQETTISLQDSVLLKQFWAALKTAINTKDKSKLVTLCEFPFYCHPCIDKAMPNKNEQVTVRVTKILFRKSQFKLFFEKPFEDKMNSPSDFLPALFYQAFDERNKPKGFSFSYTIVAPSRSFEGRQGWVYLDKIKGRYKITGIDTVP